MAKTVWVRFHGGVYHTTVEYAGVWCERYSSFEAFVDNWKQGWGDDMVGRVEYAITTGPNVEPMIQDWKHAA